MKKVFVYVLKELSIITLILAPLVLSFQPALASQNDGLHYYDVVEKNVLSRSSLPNNEQIGWLSDQGVKSLVDLIPYSESKKANITKLANFKSHSFHFLHLAIPNSTAPTNSQATKFLNFVTSSSNQPVHVFCKAGIARTGTIVALYRYSVQGWTMSKAINESRNYGVGVSKKQKTWLNQWASNHKAGAWK